MQTQSEVGLCLLRLGFLTAADKRGIQVDSELAIRREG